MAGDLPRGIVNSRKATRADSRGVRSGRDVISGPVKYWICLLAILVGQLTGAMAGGFIRVDAVPNVWVWTDTCNVYVVKDGDAALLIDLGDGSVLDRLGDLGVKESNGFCSRTTTASSARARHGYFRWGSRAAVPQAERELFEKPAKFRNMNVSLGDPFTIHGSSYVRPPIQPIPVGAR